MPLSLDTLRVQDPVLTQIANAYQNEIFIANKLFPVVSVSKAKGKVPSWDKASFIIRDTYRSLQGKSNTIPATEFSLVEFETKEHDVEIPIDYLESEEAEAILHYETRLVKQLQDVLDLEKEKAVADFTQTVGNYASGWYKTYTATHGWDPADDAAPLTDIQVAKTKIRQTIGKEPNTLVLAQNAWDLLQYHPDLLAMVAYSGMSKISVDILKQIIDVPNIYVGKGIYSADGGTTITDLWKDCSVLAYVDESDKASASLYNPSWGYTFQRKGMPQVDVYYTNGGKVKMIRNTDNYGIKEIAAGSAYLFNAVTA